MIVPSYQKISGRPTSGGKGKELLYNDRDSCRPMLSYAAIGLRAEVCVMLCGAVCRFPGDCV
jgi:hypothetical protein